MSARFKMTREFYIPTGDNLREIRKDHLNAVVYTYESNNETTGKKLYAAAFAGKRAKPDWHYRFRNELDRQRRISEWFKSQEDRAAHKQAELEKENAVRAAGNPYKVGQILYNSWGYDQTNIDFYEVVEVKKSTVYLRPLAEKHVGPAGFMSDHAEPIPGQYTGPAIRKTVQYKPYGAYLSIEHGSLSEYDGRPKYVSWYA